MPKARKSPGSPNRPKLVSVAVSPEIADRVREIGRRANGLTVPRTLSRIVTAFCELPPDQQEAVFAPRFTSQPATSVPSVSCGPVGADTR
jgi:hypothetical protein